MVNEDIFTIVDGELSINKDYVRGLPKFRVILERDKGSKGDQDGRKKFKAFKEFMYIYMRGSLFSYINKGGYNEKEAHKESVRASKLDEDFKPDLTIREAIEEYRRIQIIALPTLSTIYSVLKGLKASDEVIQIILEGIEERVETYRQAKKNKKEREESKAKSGLFPAGSNPPENIVDEVVVIDGAISQIEKLISLGNKIPTIINTLEALDERLKKEQSGTNLVRGGREKGSRADPKNVM